MEAEKQALHSEQSADGPDLSNRNRDPSLATNTLPPVSSWTSFCASSKRPAVDGSAKIGPQAEPSFSRALRYINKRDRAALGWNGHRRPPRSVTEALKSYSQKIATLAEYDRGGHNGCGATLVDNRGCFSAGFVAANGDLLRVCYKGRNGRHANAGQALVNAGPRFDARLGQHPYQLQLPPALLAGRSIAFVHRSPHQKKPGLRSRP